MTRPFFVVGTPRSGTTLLSSLLSAHSGLSVLPETQLLNRWVPPDARGGEAAERYLASRRFAYLGLDPSSVRARMADGSARSLLAALLEAHAAHTGKDRPGEKTPAHARWVPTLLSWFPDARILFVVRDPRAVVASLRDTPWGRRHPVALHARRWRSDARRLAALALEPRMLTVGYEELVADPAGSLREVCAFLDVPFEAAMTEGGRRATGAPETRSGWAADHLQAAQGAVVSSRVERWRERLTPREVAMVEYVCGPEMEARGYARTLPPPGRLGAGVLSASVFALRVASRVRRGLRGSVTDPVESEAP